ncbi:helix-turn-helix domain-containing protein [Paenibacillus sp. ClWae2A]|uniref:helix-turn-helix domain-containing protein n=1 Tax=Paenibacillus sp. ClWae2A TaxID=3057177 RepID=UPI0028F6B1F1|nr:helix-turn-helix domain-containing protein [Paenibacillus sp. ClWae2A]MDT9722416.1 helix-turn-helix domain-containing protein [Paenibacillus sp. ClWae2A]
MLGPKIRQIREQLGLSQKQLAGEDMTRSYISLIEKGRAVPSQRMLKIIARRLNTPMEFFLGGSASTDTDIGGAVLDKAKSYYAEQNDSACIRIAHKALTLTEDTSDQSEAYLLILRSYNRLGDYRQALDEGENAAFTVIRTGDRERIVEYYLEMGRAAFHAELFHAARKHYEQAYTYSSRLKHLQEEHIQSLTFLGTTHLRLGNVDEGLNYYLKAEKEAQMAGQPELYGEITLGLGKAYYMSEQDGHMLLSYDWTKRSVQAYKQARSESYVLALHNLAVIQLHMGQKKEALPLLDECARIYDKRNLPHKKASILEEISKIYLEQREPEQAEAIIKEALQLLDQQDEGMLRAKLYRLLGIVFHEKNNSNEGYYFLRMSHDLLKRIYANREADISHQLLLLSLQDRKMNYEDYKSFIK